MATAAQIARGYTGCKGRCGSAGSSTRIESPGLMSPSAITMPMTPALRIRLPSASRSSVAAIRPFWKVSIWMQGLRKSGDLDHGACPQMQPRARRQRQQIDAVSGDVLAEVGGTHDKTLHPQFLEQFGVDQVHLAQVGLGRIAADAGTVLDRLAHMGVAGDAQSREQANAQGRRLAEVMAAAGADGDDAAHGNVPCHASPNTRRKIVSTCLKW